MKEILKNNERIFKIYVFLSTFARNLVEVFIPIILYKNGFAFKDVILYYLLANLFSILWDYPCVLLSKKYNNKVLAFIGMVSFFALQYILNFVQINMCYLVIVSLLYSLYRQAYWMSRRFYNLKILRGGEISKKYSVISIINQLGVVISAYLGSLVLDYVSVAALTIISVCIFLLSIVILFFLKFDHEKNSDKLHLLSTLKSVPKADLVHFGLYELLTVVKFLFALYIFIYIKDNYQTIGIINVVTNISIMLFAYFYGKFIDKKKNLLKLSILLVVLTFLFKANVTNYLIIIISFIEGITTKMYEISLNSCLYNLSKKYEYYNYNLMYEVVLNTFRTALMFILFIFNFDLRTMIYISLLIVILGVFINFKDADIEKYKIDDK